MPPKRRKVASYLDSCRSTMDSNEPLRNPNSTNSPVLRSKERNDLTPRKKRLKIEQAADSSSFEQRASCDRFGFSSATQVLSDNRTCNETLNRENDVQEEFDYLNRNFNTNFPGTSTGLSYRKGKTSSKGKLSPQKNTLMNYNFTKTSPSKIKEIAIPMVEEDDEVVVIREVGSRMHTPIYASATADSLPRRPSITSQALQGTSTQSALSSRMNVSDPYGLLGLGDPNEWQFDDFDPDSPRAGDGPIDMFTVLPEHVLENIFVLMPLTDVLLNVVLVCKRFKEIIQNSKFLYWKKLYHQLKCRKSEAVVKMQEEFIRLKMTKLENILPALPRCLLGFRNSNMRHLKELLKTLQGHPHFTSANIFLKEASPECVLPMSEDPNPWCLIGAFAALSQRVEDMKRILHLLSHSTCSLVDAVEVLYCLATYLYYATSVQQALYKPHYNVFYALYLFENEWKATISDLNAAFCHSGQQNMLKYSKGESFLRMTHEQMRIVNHPLADNQIVKVVAFAGTGKTSTLIHFSRLRPGLRFRLVVYNKAAKEKASKEFPANVECRTMNSIAFEVPGKKLRHKLAPNLKPLDIMRHLKQKPKLDRFTYAHLVLTALDRFMNSADPIISLTHAYSSRPISGREEVVITEEIAQSIILDAQHLWEKMIDPFDMEVRCLHDTYLKLYQLQKPVWNGYNCILVDEAQDCNPAMLDVVLNQTCPKIIVGDPNQQIYGFRGAVNALESVEITHTYYLTQSFRFGPEIAYVAHCVLAVLKDFTKKTLVGGKQESHVRGKFSGQLAVIARCNSTLFDEAVRLLCRKRPRPHEPPPDKVLGCFVGGVKTYNLGQLVDIYNLMSGNSTDIKDKFISRFTTFQSLQNYAKKAKDAELCGKVSLVSKHTHRIPEYVDTLLKRCKTDIKLANVIYSTAHKSKGLEFDTVCLTDDYSLGVPPEEFLYFIQRRRPAAWPMEIANEYNTLYVALTRAKKCLLLSESLRQVLLAAQEKFEVPVLANPENNACKICNQELLKPDSKKSFVLYQKSISLMERPFRRSGFLCTDCASPTDEQRMASDTLIKDKARYAYLKILGSKVNPPNIIMPHLMMVIELV